MINDKDMGDRTMAEEHIYTEKELKEMADALLKEDDARNEEAKPKRKTGKKKEAEASLVNRR